MEGGEDGRRGRVRGRKEGGKVKRRERARAAAGEEGMEVTLA